MTFGTITLILAIFWVCGYVGMIGYDLFIKKDPEDLVPKPKDVEVDISDEVGQFKPITVENGRPKMVTVPPKIPDCSEDSEAETGSSKTDDKADAEESDDPPADIVPPIPTDEETKRRIQALVKQRRQEMLAEDESNKPIEHHNPPEFHNDAFFDIKVVIDRTKQLTKLQDGQAAEQLSREARRASLDEVLMTTKNIDAYWEKKDTVYVPDNDEQEAVRRAAMASREAPPTFNLTD